MKYFFECKTLDELKIHYRKIAKENHPDRGGDEEVMKEITIQYEEATKKILAGLNLDEEEQQKQTKFSEEYRVVIEKIWHLEDIIIQIVGTWIWVEGKTYPVRKILSAAEFKWHKVRQAWYYSSDEYTGRGSNQSLDQIKAKHGCTVVNGHGQRAIH